MKMRIVIEMTTNQQTKMEPGDCLEVKHSIDEPLSQQRNSNNPPYFARGYQGGLCLDAEGATGGETFTEIMGRREVIYVICYREALQCQHSCGNGCAGIDENASAMCNITIIIVINHPIQLFADRSIAPCTFDKNYPKEVARDFHEKSTIEVEMATVQAHQELNLPVSQKTTDYISLTMAALSFVNPWAVSTKPSSWVEPEIGSPEARDRVITLAEVTYHDSPRDCWVVIYDRVYDITTFLDEHPGGADIMLEYAGRDASTAFRGSGHSVQAAKALDRFIVGELPMHERMYRRPGGMRLSDIPE